MKIIAKLVVFILLITIETTHATTIRIPPIYPKEAYENCIEGYTLLEFTVTEKGEVTDIVILKSVPKGVFDEVSVNALKKSKYKPQLQDGVPITIRNVQRKFSFELDPGSFPKCNENNTPNNKLQPSAGSAG